MSGTTYANGGIGSASEAYIPYTAYETLMTDLGETPVGPGDTIQLRDIQAFSYAGNNGDPAGSRFGSITIPGIPEPATWAMMLIGFGGLGAAMRMRRRGVGSALAAA
jgi:hypothetical protein